MSCSVAGACALFCQDDVESLSLGLADFSISGVSKATDRGGRGGSVWRGRFENPEAAELPRPSTPEKERLRRGPPGSPQWGFVDSEVWS